MPTPSRSRLHATAGLRSISILGEKESMAPKWGLSSPAQTVKKAKAKARNSRAPEATPQGATRAAPHGGAATQRHRSFYCSRKPLEKSKSDPPPCIFAD